MEDEEEGQLRVAAAIRRADAEAAEGALADQIRARIERLKAEARELEKKLHTSGGADKAPSEVPAAPRAGPSKRAKRKPAPKTKKTPKPVKTPKRAETPEPERTPSRGDQEEEEEEENDEDDSEVELPDNKSASQSGVFILY